MSAPRVPPTTVKDRVIAGFTQAAARYDEGGTEFSQDMRARLAGQAGVHAGAHVLDVGCGKDPRWVPVMAALDAYVPPGMSRFGAFFRRPPFDAAGHVEQMLTEAGYHAAQTLTDQVDTVCASAEQWWAACRSQALWAVAWRHIPPARLDAARDAFTVLDGLAGPGGTLTRTLTFACTTGEKPGGSAGRRGTP